MQQNMTTQDAYLQATAGVGCNRMFPEGLPCTLPPGHAHHGFNPVDHFPTNRIPDQDPCLYPPPPPSTYEGLFSSSMFGRYDGQSSADHLRLLSDAVLGQVIQPCTVPFGLQAEIGSLTAQQIMDAKALAASKSHSEAERRRRERINNHLAKLRSLLPSTTKTDKASLLAEVIQHVKELKRQTSIISEYSPLPTEMDEITFDNDADEEGRLVIKASICCEDRSDLLPDLIKTLKALRLRTLKAEITTLGRRVKNVLFITGDDDQDLSWNYEQETPHVYSISSIEEALKEVMKKTNGDECSIIRQYSC